MHPLTHSPHPFLIHHWNPEVGKTSNSIYVDLQRQYPNPFILQSW